MKKEYYELEEKLNDLKNDSEGMGGFYDWMFKERESVIEDYIAQWEDGKNYEWKLSKLKEYIDEHKIEI